MKTSRKLAILSISVIVAGVFAAIYLSRLSVVPAISLAPTSFVAVQGTQISFTVYGLESNGMATIYFGDGREADTTSTLTYIYQNPGRYLVGAQEFVNGQPVSSTFSALQTIQVTPQINESLAPLISVPAISFEVSKNPSAPVVREGDSVYLYGGFLEPPSGSNMSITQYDWDFGNGIVKTVTANSTSLKPVGNPSSTSYSQPGLIPVTLTLVTENSTSMATYKTSIEQTVAVSSPSQPFSVFLYGGTVPNPSVINVAENFGPPFSLDPAVQPTYFLAGWEIVINIFSSLLVYNGSSTTNFIPMAATQVPSVANGEISPDYMTYTFLVRPGVKFSNGDPLTAYDAWYSTLRAMLFVGGVSVQGTSDWVLAQYLVPGVTAGFPIMANATDTADYNAIMKAVTYSNSSNTVTFKLIRPVLPQLFFTAIVDYPRILDSNWLQQVGAGITFTPAGFYAYENQGNGGSYNLKVQNDPVASGPYMIQNYVLGQSVTLAANPGFLGVPGIPRVNNSVVIQWVNDLETIYNLFKSGQVDITPTLIGTGEATDIYFPLLRQQVASGQAALYQFPSIAPFFFSFNPYINETAMKTDLGLQYHIPSDYFANLDVREAFAYAFNYTNYVSVIQGNSRYGIDFGENYAGAIPRGLGYHVPESELQNVPTYNLTYAKQLLQKSGEYSIPINIPIVIFKGDSADYSAAQMWAAAVNSIDPNIAMTPMYLPLRIMNTLYTLPCPMPIFIGLWTGDYPHASDYVDNMYKEGVGYAWDWSTDYLNSTGYQHQASILGRMNSLIEEADSTTNVTLAAQDYKEVEQLAINMYMYVYLSVPTAFWIVKPYMTGYQGQISYQMNPIIGGAGMGLYYWWVKGCENPQACSGRNIGP